MRVIDTPSLSLRYHVERIDLAARRLGWHVDMLRNSGADASLAEARYRRYVAASMRLWRYAATRAGVPVCCYVAHGDCGRNHA